MGRPSLNLTEEEKRERKNAARRVKEKKSKRYTRKVWLREHPEDQWIDDENQMSRKTGYSNDDIRQLMAAICLRACVDYKKASMGQHIDGIKPEVMMEQCHYFFMDDIFQYFVNRIPVEEIEQMIKNTPPGSIHSIWKKSENLQKPVKV